MERTGQRGERFEGACPLCRAEQVFVAIPGADARRYYHCDACSLIFVDPRDYLSPQDQIARYRTHQNSIENAGYVAFLRRIVDPMLTHLDASMRGLDFGCGPGPTLSLLVEQQGIACANYDPYFAPIELQPPYDFIFATECFEHFTAPADDISRLQALLRCGGLLGIMTEQWTDLESFRRWYYTRDATHVSFFHARSFDHVCATYGFEQLPTEDNRAVILRKLELTPSGRG